MLAARIHGFGRPVELEERPEPTVAEGESLVAVEAAVVGHLDLGVAGGRFPLLPTPPYTPGTGGAGRVLDSDSLEPGTLVEIRGGGVGLLRDGTWAERIAVPDDALHVHPETADPIVVATFYNSFVTAHVAMFEVGRLQRGERVAVTGAAGAVGSIAVRLALEAGAGSVVGIVGRAARAADVPPGAGVAVGVEGAMAALAPPVDLLADTVGGEYLPGLIEHVAPGGRIALVGYTAGESVALDLPSLLFHDVSLLPVNLIRWRVLAGDALSAAARADVLRARTPSPLQTFALTEVREAVETLGSGRAIGRVVLLPGG